MPSRIPFSDDWKRHWQQSIAVRISGIVLWVLVPVVLAVSFLLLYNLEEDIRKEHQFNIDVLMHRTIMSMTAAQGDQLAAVRDSVEKLRRDMGFKAVEIRFNGRVFLTGSYQDSDLHITRTSSLQSHGGGVHGEHAQAGHVEHAAAAPEDMIVLTAYHEPVSAIARNKQKNIVIPILGGLLIFGVFLVLAIRTIVHKPLQLLVDATRAISAGDEGARLNENRPDEFGYLAKFFNDMIDELTDKKHMLEHALADATRANQAKSIFLANTSHELRTPLNAIIGYSEMLAEEASCCDKKTLCFEDVCKIRESGKHLLGLINNILDLSKIEAGKTELFVEEVSLSHLTYEVGATLKPLLDSAHDKLIVECAENLGVMRTDQTKLRQILYNLLSNAIKFTENGEIRLTVWMEQRNAKDMMCFRVSDNGIGIPANKMHFLFQAFSQVDLSATRKYGGSGLGLVICKHFCTMLGGDITVQSSVGKGTAFDFYLPKDLDVELIASKGVAVNVVGDFITENKKAVKS